MEQLNKDFLKKIGISDDSMWITMCDPSWTEFFLWMQANITEKNILQFSELKQIEDLKRSNELLSPDKVKNILAAAEAEHPGIFADDLDAEIEEMERRLSDAKKVEEKYKMLEAEMKELEVHAENELSRQESLAVEHEINMEKTAVKCDGAARILEALEEENVELYGKLKDLYTKKQDPPAFMFQVPLFKLSQKSFEFRSILETFVESDPLLKPFEDTETFDSNVCKVTAAKDALLAANQNLLAQKLDHVALKNIGNLKMISAPQNLDDLQAQLLDYEAANVNAEISIENLSAEVYNEMERLTLLKVEEILGNVVKYRAERAEARVQRLQALKDLANQVTNAVELVWICLKLERDRMNIDGECETSIEGTQRRINAMTRITSQMPENQAEEKLFRIFRDHLRTQFETWPEVLQQFNETMRHFEGKLHSLTLNVDLPVNSMRELQEVESKMKAFIYGGPTETVQTINPRLFPLLQEAEARTKHCEEQYRKLQENFVDRYQEPRKKDRYLKIFSRLWYWFLTEPKQVIEAIKQVSDAAKKSFTAEEKVISGIRRKV